MPQMAPMSWLILFIMFSIAFMVFNMMNYYSITPMPHKTQASASPLIKSMNWKW